mgnify:FL=1
MALLTVTAANVRPIDSDAEIYHGIAAAAITAGQALYRNSDGKFALATAAAAGTCQFKGIALNAAGAGDTVSYLARGRVAGFTVSQAYDAPIYISDTAGSLGDAAGTVTTAIIGRVEGISTGPDITKVLYVEAVYGAKFA